MQELEQLLGLIPKALAVVGPYPLWIKVVTVTIVIVAGLLVLRAVQGEGGE